jgi:hypothetical protein
VSESGFSAGEEDLGEIRKGQGIVGMGKGSAGEKMKLYRERIIRCPRLGGEVPFSYCEREAGELPCRQVVRCWNAGFPVEEYLRETLTPEVWDRFRSEIPKDRMTTLLDIVESARQRQKKQRETGDKRLNTGSDHSRD